jgi:outer membrane protein assembly factor BamB
VGQSGEWLTFSHDPQRSGSATDEHSFSSANVSAMGLLWKTIVPNQPLALTGLTAPLVMRGVSTPRGLKNLVFVAGSSDHLFALDAENGEMVWRFDANNNRADSASAVSRPGPSSWLCPYSLNATPVIDSAGGRIFLVTSDGRLHTLALGDGHTMISVIQFVRAFSKMWSLNYSRGVLYTTISQGCADTPSGVVAMNPDSPGHPVVSFFTTNGVYGGGIWGRGGSAIDFSGFVYGATGDAPFDPALHNFGDTLVKLSPATLQMAGYYAPINADYLNQHDLDLGAATPAIFHWRNRVLAAGGGKEGTVFVVDTVAMSGVDHRAGYVSPLYTNRSQTFEKNGIQGAISVWRDPNGPTWVYAPAWGDLADAARFPVTNGPVKSGTVMAFKVEEDSKGKALLVPAWMSGEIAVPDPIAVAGGVVFVLGTGENTDQAHGGDINHLQEKREDLPAGHAILHALDGRTGQELWSSGNTMASWTHFSGLAIGDGKVSATTRDGAVYAFGIRQADSPAAHFSNYSESAPPSLVTAESPSPVANPNGTIPQCGESREVFRQRCSSCHGTDGKGLAGTHTPNFSDPAWQKSLSDAELIDAAKHGKQGGMPPFGDMLTSQQIDSLIRCVVRGVASSPAVP